MTSAFLVGDGSGGYFTVKYTCVSIKPFNNNQLIAIVASRRTIVVASCKVGFGSGLIFVLHYIFSKIFVSTN